MSDKRRLNDFSCDDLGDSPFDMAPDMNKQFSNACRDGVEEFNIDDMGGDCEGIDQFMSGIDNFIENQIC